MNYSRITLEAGMVMKKASGMISPLQQGARKSFISPRSRDDGGGGYELFHEDLIGSLRFLHRGAFIGEGARSVGGQGPHTLPRRGLTLGCA